MDTKQGDARIGQLRELLTAAGHFPRPLSVMGNRFLEVDPGFYEDHDRVVLQPTAARIAAARKGSSGAVERLNGNPNVRVTRFLEKSHQITALNDDGAEALEVVHDAECALRGRQEVLVRCGDDYPRDWSAQRRKGWKVASRTPSPIDERLRAVASLRRRIKAIVVPMLKDPSGPLPNPPAWQRLIDDDLLDHENVAAARESLPAVGKRLNTVPFKFHRILVEANGGRLSYQALFVQAQKRDPSTFKGKAPNTRHMKAIRDLVGVERDGTVVRGNTGRGPGCEFWVERT